MAEGFILGLLAETPLHPGAGQSAGVVDLPVAREGPTGLPQIPETGLKGALKQWAEGVYGIDSPEIRYLFGAPEAEEENGRRIGGAGELLISTARLLFLPIRRLDGAYAWTTSPYLLERLGRDAERARVSLAAPACDPNRETLLVAEGEGRTVFLEEYVFTTGLLGDNKAMLDAIVERLVGSPLAEGLKNRAAVMHDDEYAWFAEHSLPVDARNSLDDAKMSQNLWYEETMPPDTMLYAVILPRVVNEEAVRRFDDFARTLGDAGFVQAGGNETVGHGWLRVSIVKG